MTTQRCTTREQPMVAETSNASGLLHRLLRATGAAISVRGTYSKLCSRLAIRHQQRIDRQAFENMLSLDDDLLQDIGVTRDAVRWAAGLPLQEDAALALRDISRQHNHAGIGL